MSNRRLARTYTLQAVFGGAGVLVADPHPLFPRSFLWAHLDDGIMESVTTNWGNEGIFMEGVGPSLVGRATNGLGPLQQVLLGGALYFDANGSLAYDPSALEAQIVALQQQQLADEAIVVSLTNQQLSDKTAILARLTADETLISNNAATIAALQTALATANAQIIALQQQVAFINSSALFKTNILNTSLSGAGSLAASLRQTDTLTAQLLGSIGSPLVNLSLSIPGFQSLLLNPFTVNSNLLVSLSQKSPSIVALLAGAGQLPAVNITQAQGYSTWDPLQGDSANLVYSNNYRTVTYNGGTANWASGRGTKSQTSGKYYFEFTINSLDTSEGAMEVGVIDTTIPSGGWGSPFEPGANTHSAGILTGATGSPYDLYYNNVITGLSGLPHAAANDVIGVAVDLTNPSSVNIYFRVNTLWSNKNAPSTTMTTPDATISTGLPLYPAQTASGNPSIPTASQSTLNVGNAAFAHTLPPGFTAWG